MNSFLLYTYLSVICLPVIHIVYFLFYKLILNIMILVKNIKRKSKRYTVDINPPLLRQLFSESVFKNHSFFELAFMNTSKLLKIGKHTFDAEKLYRFHKANPKVDVLTNGSYHFYKLSSIETINYLNFIHDVKSGNYIEAETTEQLILDFIQYGGFLFIKEDVSGELSENEVRTLVANIKNRNKKVTSVLDYKIITETEKISEIVKSELKEEFKKEYSDSSSSWKNGLNYAVKSIEKFTKDEMYDEDLKDFSTNIRFKYSRSNVSMKVYYKKSRPYSFTVCNPQVRKEVIEKNIDLEKLRIF
jgi:hypothetical protein